MSQLLENLKSLLDQYGRSIVDDMKKTAVHSTSCIDTYVPDSPGVYWIETTMPVEEMRIAISNVIGKNKRIRKTPPKSAALIRQNASDYYVAYSGTEDDIRKRLKQHLFNEGHANTIKLGCVIDEEPFSNYQWRIGFAEIDSYEFRYAVEAWWRLNVGWPPFCLR